MRTPTIPYSSSSSPRMPGTRSGRFFGLDAGVFQSGARAAGWSSGSRGGFTLVELLAVILIIGILAAILIPVVGSVRASGRSSVCMSNMRQLGIGTQLYLADHANVMYPHNADVARPGDGTKQWRWFHYLQSYIPSDKAPGNKFRCMLFCPESEVVEARSSDPATKQDLYATTGYSKNGNLGRTSGSYFVKKINGAYPPTKVVLFWDDVQQTDPAVQNTNNNGGWPASDSPYAPGSWYKLAFRHRGQCHLVFLDGHVTSVASGTRGDARDFSQFMWGPFPDYADTPYLDL